MVWGFSLDNISFEHTLARLVSRCQLRFLGYHDVVQDGAMPGTTKLGRACKYGLSCAGNPSLCDTEVANL